MKIKSILTFLLENKNTRQTVIRNGFWRAASLGFNKLIRFFVVLFAARWLGPEQFGEYNYILSLMGLAFIFSDWGVNLLMIRNIHLSPEKEQEVFSTAFLLKLISTGVSAVAALVLALLVGGGIAQVAMFIVMAMVLTNVREIYVSVMIAKQRGELEVVAAFVEGICLLLLFFGFLRIVPSSIGYAVMNSIVIFVSLIISVFLVKKYLGFHLRSVSLKSIRQLAVNGAPLALFGIAGYIFFSSDQLFIKYFLGVNQVGYFALAARVVYAAQLIPSLIVSVLFPVLSRRVREQVNLYDLFMKGFIGLFVLGFFTAASVILFRSWILFIAPQYEATLPVIASLGCILVFLFPSVWLDNVLIALDKQKQDLYLTLIAAAVNVVLALWWIPMYGIFGAVYAGITSQAINTLLTFFYARFVIRHLSDERERFSTRQSL